MGRDSDELHQTVEEHADQDDGDEVDGHQDGGALDHQPPGQRVRLGRDADHCHRVSRGEQIDRDEQEHCDGDPTSVVIDARGLGPRCGFQAQKSTKFRRIRSPTSPDFSGWNWVPITWPSATTLAKVSPYSVVTTVAASSSGTA